MTQQEKDFIGAITKIALSKKDRMNKEELKEFIKCGKDPIYFLNTYGWVYDVKIHGQLNKLTCFEFQEDILEKFKNNQYNIVLKGRQLGLSVITAGFVVWTFLFRTDQKIQIVANDRNSAVRFLKTVKKFLEFIPKFIYDEQKDILKNNEQLMELKNGNFIKAVASGNQAGRGEVLTMLIMDECAFIENAEDIWMASSLTLTTTNGKCIIISTPNGTSNLYHTMWDGSEKGENEFVGTKVHWIQHPVYSIGNEEKIDEYGKKYLWSPWYEEESKKLNNDRVKIAQELDLSFEGSQATVIEAYIIERYEKNLLPDKDKPVCYYDYTIEGKAESRFFDNRQTKFWVWEKPQSGKNYIISCDVARSVATKADYSTIQILDADTVTQVAEYQDKIPPDLFAKVIYNAGKDYNNAYAVVECNNFGLVTSLKLKNDLKYDTDRIYHSKSVKKIISGIARISIDADDEIPGFQTTTITRPLLMDAIGEYMRDGKISLFSRRLLSEFKTFVEINGKQQHAPGYHDDLIFALAIGLYIRNVEFQNVFYSKEFYKAMLNNISQTVTEARPVDKNTHIQDSVDYTPKMGNIKNTDGDDDLTWLYGNITTG